MNLKNNPTLKSSKIRVGLTIGDPAGIGPAITLKALKILKGKADFTVIGDSFVLAKAAKILKISLDSVKLVNLNNVEKSNFSFGSLSAHNGRSSLEYLDKSLELLRNGQIDCLVTCPISKEAIDLAGCKFSGHTEYLGMRTGAKDLVMMLVNKKIKFSLATRHVRLGDVPRMLTRRILKKNILDTVRGLQGLFLIKRPKLVVCGINPHASDNGVIGTEEQSIITPVIRSLNNRSNGFFINKVLGADVAIAQAVEGKFDCVIAAYHDQALIALKLTGF